MQVKYSDFGLAIQAKPGAKTKYFGSAGTWKYKSPEMIGQRKGYKYETDIWGLGVVLYKLLFGLQPFKGKYLD